MSTRSMRIVIWVFGVVILVAVVVCIIFAWIANKETPTEKVANNINDVMENTASDYVEDENPISISDYVEDENPISMNPYFIGTTEMSDFRLFFRRSCIEACSLITQAAYNDTFRNIYDITGRAVYTYGTIENIERDVNYTWLLVKPFGTADSYVVCECYESIPAMEGDTITLFGTLMPGSYKRTSAQGVESIVQCVGIDLRDYFVGEPHGQAFSWASTITVNCAKPPLSTGEIGYWFDGYLVDEDGRSFTMSLIDDGDSPYGSVAINGYIYDIVGYASNEEREEYAICGYLRGYENYYDEGTISKVILSTDTITLQNPTQVLRAINNDFVYETGLYTLYNQYTCSLIVNLAAQ